MGAVKTPGQECSALLQGLLACHIREVQRGNGTDTALVLTDSQMGREGKPGRSHRSLRLMLKEPAECHVGLTWGGKEGDQKGFLLYVYPEAQAGASPSTVQGGRALQLRGPKFGAEHKGRGGWAEI